MPEPLTSAEPTNTQPRTFPWYCPKCHHKTVFRATIPYKCERLHNGQPITVAIANLSVPKCENCGELVFDYDAEEQINRAYEACMMR